MATIQIGAGAPFSYAQLAASGTTPLVIDSPQGVLTITGYAGTAAGGTVSYSYTLDTTVANGPASDQASESFAVVVTDDNGSTDSDSLDITIVDDKPVARPDTDDVGTGNTATGNVMTDASAGDGADTDVNAADTLGADGASVTHVKSDNGGDPLTAVGASVTINGQYGTLMLEADGDYTYTRTSSSAGTDVFTYTLKDGDGDTDTATLTINLSSTNVLVVGSNESDDTQADPTHAVPGPAPLDNNGIINGLDSNDILVGDSGAAPQIGAGDTANICLVLDTTASLSAAQMTAMQNAVIALLNDLSTSGATAVRVSLFAFGGGYTDLGTFDIVIGGVANAANLAAAINRANGGAGDLQIGADPGSGTHYLDGLQAAIDWITPGAPVSSGPLAGGTVNKVIFVSDGEPEEFGLHHEDQCHHHRGLHDRGGRT